MSSSWAMVSLSFLSLNISNIFHIFPVTFGYEKDVSSPVQFFQLTCDLTALCTLSLAQGTQVGYGTWSALSFLSSPVGSSSFVIWTCPEEWDEKVKHLLT